MTGFGRTVMAAVAACALATTADAQRAHADSGTIATFAREWSTGLGAPRCERQPGWMGAGTRCTWGPAQSLMAPWLQYTPSEVRGAPAAVMWHRLASDPAHAQRMIDSLDAALVARGAARRACGTGDVPAGHVTGTVWEGDGLAVHVSRIDEPRGTARVLVAASDQARVLSLDMMCGPRDAVVTTRRDTTRVQVTDPDALVFHPGAVVQVVTVLHAGDSALTIVQHRTGRPAADSADVRRTLVATLARPRILEDEPWLWAGAGPGVEVGRLVVRPCWTDACPRLEQDRVMAIQPGDLVFVRQADRSWKPQR